MTVGACDTCIPFHQPLPGWLSKSIQNISRRFARAGGVGKQPFRHCMQQALGPMSSDTMASRTFSRRRVSAPVHMKKIRAVPDFAAVKWSHHVHGITHVREISTHATVNILSSTKSSMHYDEKIAEITTDEHHCLQKTRDKQFRCQS